MSGELLGDQGGRSGAVGCGVTSIFMTFHLPGLDEVRHRVNRDGFSKRFRENGSPVFGTTPLALCHPRIQISFQMNSAPDRPTSCRSAGGLGSEVSPVVTFSSC